MDTVRQKGPNISGFSLMILLDHLIGSPLSFADEKYAEKAWVKFDDIAALQHPQFRCILGSVKSVDLQRKVARTAPHQKTETKELEYDFLIAATGLRRTSPSVPLDLTREKYLEEVRPHIERVSKAEHGVAVIGGGEWACVTMPLIDC